MINAHAVEGVEVGRLRDHRLVVVTDVYTVLLREDHLALPGAPYFLHHLREQVQIPTVKSTILMYGKAFNGTAKGTLRLVTRGQPKVKQKLLHREYTPLQSKLCHRRKRKCRFVLQMSSVDKVSKYERVYEVCNFVYGRGGGGLLNMETEIF